MTSVVMGGAGFVGLNIAEALLGRGETVRLFDMGPPPEAALAHFATLPGTLQVEIGDVSRKADIGRAVKGGERCLIYGAAITAGPARDAREPERILAVNLTGFLDTLRAAYEGGVERIINLSSSAAYGAAAFTGDILDEGTTTPDPESLYAITKFASERVTRRMAELWSCDALSVRLSGVFGRWERVTNVRDTPSPHYQVMEAALAGEDAILPRLDARDWIYAPDVAAGIIALRDAERPSHPIYNVSTGRTHSVLAWGEALGREIPGFVCRLAEDGEAPTIDLHVGEDRKPLAVERLFQDTPFRPAFTMEGSVGDYHAFVQRFGLGSALAY
ncbi:MAG: NAD(P)-dependent oxidoreductase [Devosia sp.]